ncbi:MULTISPECIES: protein kinase [unclassified Salinibacterium]|uniref:protein kinase n=1 Tax=unclassified Salinibacterium TaxID=2632331 RepID=UPI00143D9E4B|nr:MULTISPECIES: protein kinase [unclassified Salinibacterium]
MGIIGGYRVVRRLGAGERSEVWLGRAETPKDAGGSATATAHEGTGLAAIKVYREDVASEAVDRELTALTRMVSPHIVGVIDAAAAGTRQCVVLPLLDPGGLTRLLTSRATLSRGELVTLLVPLARAVNSMHAAGVTHGSLRASKVLFSDAGAPVLLGGARMTQSPHPPSRSVLKDGREFIDDRHALWLLANDLLARAAQPEEVAGLGEWLRTEPWMAPGFQDELSERAFETGAPTPVSIPWVGLEPPADSSRQAPQSRPRREPAQHTVVRETAAWSRALNAVTGSSRSVLRRLRDAYTGVRPRFRVLGLLGVVLISGGLVVATTMDSGSTQALGPGEAAASHRVDGAASDESGVDVDTEPESIDAENGSAPDEAALTGDDPVLAARRLLTLRDACLSAASAECLKDVLQRDSAAWMADSARVIDERADGGTHVPLFREDDELAVVDIMGGVVLLSVDGPALHVETDGSQDATAERAPASVLIIRTEAGWRIRDVLPG